MPPTMKPPIGKEEEEPEQEAEEAAHQRTGVCRPGLGHHLRLAVGVLDDDGGPVHLHDEVVLELADHRIRLVRGGFVRVADDDEICHSYLLKDPCCWPCAAGRGSGPERRAAPPDRGGSNVRLRARRCHDGPSSGRPAGAAAGRALHLPAAPYSSRREPSELRSNPKRSRSRHDDRGDHRWPPPGRGRGRGQGARPQEHDRGSARTCAGSLLIARRAPRAARPPPARHVASRASSRRAASTTGEWLFMDVDNDAQAGQNSRSTMSVTPRRRGGRGSRGDRGDHQRRHRGLLLRQRQARRRDASGASGRARYAARSRSGCTGRRDSADALAALGTLQLRWKALGREIVVSRGDSNRRPGIKSPSLRG